MNISGKKWANSEWYEGFGRGPQGWGTGIEGGAGGGICIHDCLRSQ